MDGLLNLWSATGLANLTFPALAMIAVGCGLLYLAIAKGFEPLLLVPIGFGAILTNIPLQVWQIQVGCSTTFTT